MKRQMLFRCFDTLHETNRSLSTSVDIKLFDSSFPPKNVFFFKNRPAKKCCNRTKNYRFVNIPMTYVLLSKAAVFLVKSFRRSLWSSNGQTMAFTYENGFHSCCVKCLICIVTCIAQQPNGPPLWHNLFRFARMA